jgi:hypothetical protein
MPDSDGGRDWRERAPMRRQAWRALVEVAFIVFLFYSNLLMSEYTRSGAGRGHSLAWAVRDVVTPENFLIGIIAGLIGHLVFEFLRRRF